MYLCRYNQQQVFVIIIKIKNTYYCKVSQLYQQYQRQLATAADLLEYFLIIN